MQEFELSFCGPKENGFFKLLMASLFRIICLLISHFEHAHITLGQTTRAWRLVKLSVVRALDESLSTLTIKSLKVASSSSQLEF